MSERQSPLPSDGAPGGAWPEPAGAEGSPAGAAAPSASPSPSPSGAAGPVGGAEAPADSPGAVTGPVATATGSEPHTLQPRRTRTSTTYVGVGVGLLVLVLVIIFIAQNLNDDRVQFFTAHFDLPEGLIVLASVVAGGLIVLLVSLARVVQLRVAARRHRSGHRNARPSRAH